MRSERGVPYWVVQRGGPPPSPSHQFQSCGVLVRVTMHVQGYRRRVHAEATHGTLPSARGHHAAALGSPMSQNLKLLPRVIPHLTMSSKNSRDVLRLAFPELPKLR